MLTTGDPLLFYLGAALCFAAGLRGLAGGVRILRGREQQRQEADADAMAFRREAATVAGAARARLATRLAWEGRRALRVAEVRDETHDTKSIYLVNPDGRPLPRYMPGQYLTLALPTVDPDRSLVRCYSLSDTPRGECYRLTVKRQEAPASDPTAPPGVGSGWLHRYARPGLEILCESPRGAFFLDPRRSKPVVLIAAGVGVTPIVSMLGAVKQAQWKRPVHAFLGFRDGANHPLAQETRAIVRGDSNLHLRVSYSQPRPIDRLGEDYHHRGRVDLDWLQAELPSNNFEYYLCGPPGLMQNLVPELLDWGVPDDAIHYEAFGPASVATPASKSFSEKAMGSQVRFAPEQDPLIWDGACDTLLEMAESAGVPIASGCRAGNCGACRVRVVEGDTLAMKRPGMPLSEGECLACISVPAGPVLLST